ncbi:MAG: metallophosphoesterase [Pirellulaceae bacterium]
MMGKNQMHDYGEDALSRREFARRSGQAFAVGTLGGAVAFPAVAAGAKTARVFRLWAISDAHVGTDLRHHKRESLADAIRQSERGGDDGGPAFDWDVAVHLGDSSGNQGSPKDDEGQEIVRQFGAARKHVREQFYNLAGNHDATFVDERTQWWFRKWLDPTGENTVSSGVDPMNRPYPVVGTWERYTFRAGNLLFAMMSDRNDIGPPVGRGDRGGFPAGAVTSATFAWWKDLVEKNPDSIIISCHHHMLKQTTVASGEWEGFTKTSDGKWKSDYHGYFPEGGPRGASYLYWLEDKPDAQAFESYLSDNRGAIDLWLGGHTHTGPDDQKGGRSHIERKWDVNFVNVSALTRCHGHRHSTPMSRLFTFTEGSEKVRVQCYLHTSQYKPQGWYNKVERTIEMGKPFRFAVQ